MRKAQKQQVLEALKSLSLAHEEIREELRRNGSIPAWNPQRVLNMLGECQGFAISLGEAIEKLDARSHAPASSIESYCKAVYQAYTEIGRADGGAIDDGRICRMLEEQLAKIEDSVENGIAVRKEVVFLPYKASMWDSMESVWMAARDDESCDAYVIAIPYYERNRDQSLGQMHYEGNEYPDYVPIVDWQKYKIEERRPDIIYIQNPYDELNLVTCVHPRFFSKELKKHTDMLVYLPYFVGIDDHVDEHFCTTRGVMNADRVIVQSEEVKKAYIKSIREFEEENGCEGAFGDLEKKILPLGSPKLDRIRRVMESGEIELPEGWKDKIHQPNGEKKKVVLYNTTIDALLKHSGAYMDKLRSVLAVFRQEKGFVLLWRPHPLLVPTIRSMRPDLYLEYMEITRRYQEEGWGIYDETADIDRAIVLSDAYYGDWSSVVELYKVTGKPIMIQNCEMSEA